MKVSSKRTCFSSPGYLCEVSGLPVELGELLGEVRSLRAQLQSSVQESSALKQLELHKQLEQKLGVGSPRTPSLSALTASPQRETLYRRQLLHGQTENSKHTPPVTQTPTHNTALQHVCEALRAVLLCIQALFGMCVFVCVCRPGSVSTSQGHWSV